MSSMDAVNTNGIQENDGLRRIDILSQIQNGLKKIFKKNNAKYEVEGEEVCSDRLICKRPAYSVKLISLTRDRLAKAEAKTNKQKLITSSRKKNESSDSTPVEIIAPEPSEISGNAVASFHAYDDVKSSMDQNSGDLRAEKLNDSFNRAVREEVLLGIKRVLDRHKSPFGKLDSESKRLAVYEHLELYREPKLLSGNQLDLKHSTVSIVRFPLAEGLKRVLGIEGLFPAILEYYKYLRENKYPIQNFCQCKFWESILEADKSHQPQVSEENEIVSADQSHHPQGSEEGVIVLPLFGYHDNVQPGNALGSHASETNLGTFYAQIACMPPNFASKMSSIVVSDIFMSKDRKTFGNEAVFSAREKDARYLRRVGIRIQIKGKWYRVKFVLCLILGDNLGLNSIFEFISSFSNTLFCRICYAGPDLVHILIKENVSILRTIGKYEDDLAPQKPVAETGLHGRCVFKELDDFHVILNSSLDVMHDQFEGMCSYVMALILPRLIKIGAQARGYFELSE
ncbi:hypothetical protein QAD02_006909 [Eretmocerus hayati]|uniref:Uncharacterized protein n=1 Tax=Eretmocerus hayati TaxID=131215 RepID=A0ACC2N4I0_9HYME|nr:hypothetical protein QAD02_006909 [Eretmocerus hayati]